MPDERAAAAVPVPPGSEERIEQLLDFYGFLIQANGLVARAEDIDKLYGDICRLGILLDRRLVLAWVGLIEEGSESIRLAAHAGPATEYLRDFHVVRTAEVALGQGPTGRALREGTVIVVNRFLDDPSTAPWHERAQKAGIACCATLPLRHKDTVCGTLSLYASVPDVFDERITGELNVLSQTLSYAIDAADERTQRRKQAERWLALLRLAQSSEYEEASGEHEFLGRALEEAQRLTGSRVGFLHMVNEDQKTCDLVAWTGTLLNGEVHDLIEHYPIGPPGTGGIWVGSFHERRGLIVNNYAQRVPDRGTPASPLRLSRLISVPVVENEKVRVIAWMGDKAAPYDQDDLEFLQILASDAWRIVRRRRAEAELRDALQVVEASPVVFFRWRAEPGWPVEYVSRNISRWGWLAADLRAGRPTFASLVHPDDVERVGAEVAAHTAAGMSEYVQQYRLRTADGRYFWIEDSTRVIRDATGRVIAYEGVVSDIDADKKREQVLADSLAAQRELNRKLESAQNQLLQSEKMASIGQLAAGVAHELNNPIGFVNSNLGTLENYLGSFFTFFDICDKAADASAHPEEFAAIKAAKLEHELDYLRSDTLELLAESKEGLERVRKIVLDLKDFSRVGEVQWQWADIHHGLDSTLNIVWNELKYKCTVTKHYGDLPQIYCLPFQLNQVFMNLLVNAAQAIEQHGEITLTTDMVRHNDADCVRIRVADTGRGIPPEIKNRIFDPFFTTKPVGKGTGLGLSLAWGIVQRHGGSIEVDSTLGQGSTFTITLPVEPPPDKVAEREGI